MSQKPTNTKDETKPDAQADLDARVASLLGEMDQTHDRVVQRLDWPAGSEQEELDRQLSEAMASVAEVADAPPPSAMSSMNSGEHVSSPATLDDEISAAMSPAVPAAKVESMPTVDQGEGASESIASSVASDVARGVFAGEPSGDVREVAPEQAEMAGASTAAVVTREPATESVVPALKVEQAVVVKEPTAAASARPSTITDLDNQLSQALAEPTEDEFADASEVLASEAPPVDLKASRQAEVPTAVEPAAPQAEAPAPVVAAAAAPVPIAPPRDDEFEEPARVPTPAPSVAPAASTAKAAPASAPKPAVKAAAKPAANEEPKMTLADMFWRFATPIVEPIAGQLGRLPAKTQQTFAWIGMTTMFVGCVTWAYVLFLMPTKPPSHLLEEQEQSEQASGGHDEHDEHASKASAKAPVKSGSKHASAESGHSSNASPDEHAEPAPSGHGAAKSGGH